MKTKKRDLIPFSFYDLTGMEKHFEKRSWEGWLLDGISSFGWHYRRVEPRERRFTVTCSPAASEFEPEPTEEQRTFQDFCAHTGWVWTAASGRLQVFYNEEKDPLPIHTDPALEIAQVGKMARRILPVYGILMVIGFWMGGSWLWSLFHSPIDLLASPTALFTGACWLGLFLYGAADLVSYLTWRHRAKKAAPLGEFVPTRGCHWLLVAETVLLVLGVLYFFLAARLPGLRLMTGLLILAFLGLLLAVNGTKMLLKRLGASARVNRFVTLAVDAVLAFALVGGATTAAIRAIRDGDFSLTADMPPAMALEPLAGGEVDENYFFSFRRESSALLSQYTYTLHTFAEEDALEGLTYTIVDVHFPGVYGLCRDQLLRFRDGWALGEETAYREMAASAWGAGEAWQLYSGGVPQGVYVLCWESRLVALEAPWLFSEAQMAAAGAQLAPV